MICNFIIYTYTMMMNTIVFKRHKNREERTILICLVLMRSRGRTAQKLIHSFNNNPPPQNKTANLCLICGMFANLRKNPFPLLNRNTCQYSDFPLRQWRKIFVICMVLEMEFWLPDFFIKCAANCCCCLSPEDDIRCIFQH